uniref:Leucine-rich repeat and IQ domain-containing protein 3 n=1 Tax=Ciona savignyi TaxID=51511 RepID=H2YJZ8_CIOSA
MFVNKGQDFQNILQVRQNLQRKTKKTTPSKWENRLADAALRQAAEGGYLISPSRAFLLERCQTAGKPSLKDIEYIHLSHFHIRTLGHIQSCRHLRVCILNNNYLTRFSALENCPYLVRLDLHSNQITKLPDENFWREMKSLRILNLHDNGIGKLEDIQSLCVCVNLVVLTLYDTPLSLKANYRHHTVNSIWSLKALDHHVIGDEEIIEDSLFSKRFTAMNPKLFVDLCPKQNEALNDRTLQSEMKTVRKILSDINRILVHGSPVVVIQRWVRGHLSRKALG